MLRRWPKLGGLPRAIESKRCARRLQALESKRTATNRVAGLRAATPKMQALAEGASAFLAEQPPVAPVMPVLTQTDDGLVLRTELPR